MLFLHGNGCGPEELIGLTEPNHADAVAIDLAKSGIQVVIPFKANMYRRNHAEEISTKACVVGTTREALEQMKIRGLLDLYRKQTNRIDVLGFSHGAWQALLAGVYNRFDNLFLVDFLVNPREWVVASRPVVYRDFNASIAAMFDYPEVLKLVQSSRIYILLGSKSPYSSDRLMVDQIRKKANRGRILVYRYDGGHYLDKDLVRRFVVGSR